jgi:hypothetical protein
MIAPDLVSEAFRCSTGAAIDGRPRVAYNLCQYQHMRGSMSFIFQAVPSRYDLRSELIPGRRVSWLASRYLEQMVQGEIVYFWLAGEAETRGLYGWGAISGPAPQAVGSEYRIEVEYLCNFLDRQPPRHISAALVAKESALRNMLILRMPIGTNFLLSQREDAALRTLITRLLGPEWAPTELAAQR